MKSFKQLAELDPNTILIVDGLNLSFRWRGKVDFKDSYVNTVFSFQKSYKAGKVIITCDKGKSLYRTEMYPEYKANRALLRSKQTELERLEFAAFFKEFNCAIDILKSSEYEGAGKNKVLQYEGVEADDLMAYIVRKHSKSHKVWLISTDKDIDLLISDSVSRFSYVTKKEITKDNWYEHYDYDMDKHLSIKCLISDPGDNIPGVEGIGPKRAQALVEEYGDIYGIISSLPIISKYKYIQSLNNFGAENLLRNCNLMDLVSYCEEAVGVDNCKDIDIKLGEYLNDR